MEVTASRPTNEAAQIIAASLQSVRFKERRLREAQSDVRNEAVYFSPVIRIDRETSTAIMQYRDGSTGEVQREYQPLPKDGPYQVANAEAKSVEQPRVEVVKEVDVPEASKEEPVQSVDENV